MEAVGSLTGVGGGSGKGEIILLTPEGSGTEVLGGVDSWIFPIAILPLGTTEFVFSSSYELTWFFEGVASPCMTESRKQGTTTPMVLPLTPFG